MGGMKLPATRAERPSTMMFPKELRGAIPELPTCSGRVLVLDAMHAEPVMPPWPGPRIHLRLLVKETGKLSGKLPLLMDLEPEAARTLAKTLSELADRVKLP